MSGRRKNNKLIEDIDRYSAAALKYSQTIKRTVFHNMTSLKLCEKFHLRCFGPYRRRVVFSCGLHICDRSDHAADAVSEAVGKRRAFRDICRLFNICSRLHWICGRPDDALLPVRCDSFAHRSGDAAQTWILVEIHSDTYEHHPEKRGDKRYRLRQKLGLPKGDNLVNFIRSI